MAIVVFAASAGCSSSSSGGGGGGSSNPCTSNEVLVFSDVHFDPFYDSAIFGSLAASSEDDWTGIFDTSTATDVSLWGSETNYPLFKLMLSSIKTNGATCPVILFTGDILTHYFDTKFYDLYGSTDATAMKAFADKTFSFFAKQLRANLGTIPIMFSLGNNDAYEDYDIEPDGDLLSNTAETFYTYLLNGTADHQTFLDTYNAGGYYYAEPLTDLMVIGLNSVYFSTSAVGDVESAALAELDWLDTTLASATAAGKKVWILMHIPPGANIFSTKNHIDSEGHVTTATMMWEDAYQESFLDILSNYSSFVTLMLAGHTHMDEYRLPDGFLEITPAIAPYFNNDPAFKIFSYNGTDFSFTNYRSMNYNLATKPADFSTYYTFSSAYSLTGLLDATLAALFPTLATSTTKQALYRGYYYSGHDSASPITDLNWPVYWCGIGNTVKQDVIDCINGY